MARKLLKRKLKAKKGYVTKRCPCGELFVPFSPRQLFHTAECRKRYRVYYEPKEKETRKCLYCAKEFETQYSSQKFHTEECRISYHRKKYYKMKEIYERHIGE